MMAEYFKVEEMVRRNAPIISEYGDASSMESVLLGGLSGERQWMDLAANGQELPALPIPQRNQRSGGFHCADHAFCCKDYA